MHPAMLLPRDVNDCRNHMPSRYRPRIRTDRTLEA